MSEIDVVEARRAAALAVVVPRRPRREHSTSKLIKQRLQSWNSIPDLLRDNEFIRTGYRVNWSLKETLISLFQVHNETVNIWTHLAASVFFLCLLIRFNLRPVIPLQNSKQSLEHLWSSVQDRMHYFGEHSGENIQESFELRIRLLHASLHESITAIQSHMHENLEHARDSFHVRMEPVVKRLHGSFAALSEALHQQFHGSVEHMADSFNTKLSTMRNNLERSFTSVQESIHGLQHDLSGNIGVARSGLKRSLSGLQESLATLHAFLCDTRSQEPPSKLNQTVPENQCPNDALKPSANISESYYGVVRRWPVVVYLAGALLCLLTSSVCHLFSCCSRHAEYIWRFDYTGIAVLIVTSFYPAVYYPFLCQPQWVIFYLGCATVLGMGTVVVSLNSYMQRPEFRRLRAGLFAGLGLLGIIPWSHQRFVNFHEPWIRTALNLESVMAASYLIGAAFFVLRIPERFKPGAFDIVFSSHQIFHGFVVLAALAHYRAVMYLMEWRESTNGCLL